MGRKKTKATKKVSNIKHMVTKVDDSLESNVDSTALETKVDNVNNKVDNQEEKVSNIKHRERPKRNRGTRDRLSAPIRVGYVRRFVRDDPGRISTFKELGYEIVTEDVYMGERRDDEPAKESSAVASVPAGGGSNFILMEIPEEWYVEAKADEQAEIDKLEEGIVGRLSQESGNHAYGQVKIGKK